MTLKFYCINKEKRLMDFINLKYQHTLIERKINNRIQEVLKHGKYIMGPEVYNLEERLAKYSSSKYCVTCSSGTDALLMPLMALNIGPGDAVITTPFTYIATVEVIALLGATPIFCDIYDKTYNINPELIEKAFDLAISKKLKPKAIIPVDLFGLPARYRLIKKYAKKLNLIVIEDAAQGFGGKIGDKKAGSFGDISSTSFFPAKPLGCYGDGGAIFTNNDKFYKRLKSIRVHGSGEDKYDNVRIGINGRLDTIQAAILIEKLKIFDSEIKKRNKIAKNYLDNLSSKFSLPYIPKNYTSSWAQFSIVIPDYLNRSSVINHLKNSNIPSMVYYKIPVHLQKGYAKYGYKKGDFPVSESISENILSIPMHPYLDKDKQNRIIELLNNK